MNTDDKRLEKRITSDNDPTTAELEEEHDMPGADMETLRKAFFRPMRSEQSNIVI